MLCADIVDVEWRDKTGKVRRTVANLEDISLSGACLQVDSPIPLHTTVHIRHPQADMHGTVRYCVYREIGYFLGVEFASDSRWSQRDFRPQHMLDPRRLVARSASRVMKASASTTVH